MGLYRDEAGMVIEIDDRFAEARGYTPLDPVEHADINAQRGIEARGDERGVVGDINAAATGVVSGMSLGLTDVALGNTLTPFERERVLAEIEEHPYLRGGGEIVGAVAGAFAAPGTAAARTPAGYLSSLAGREVEQGLARGGLAGTVKALGAMGAEGAAQSAGQYIGHSALADKEVTAEGLAGSLGTGFAFGAAGGGAALGVVKGAIAGRRLWSRVMDGRAAAKQAESAWSLASQEALDADLATARVAETKLDEIRKAKMEAMRYRNEARAVTREEQIRASAAGPPAVTPDFEAGIPTNVIPREQAPTGMPTSIFKRQAPLKGPVPLDEGITPASGGQVTSVRAPTTKVIPRPEGVAPKTGETYYHGAASEITSLGEGTHYSGQNIYGEGFYTTDASDVAGSYTKKNARQVAKGGTAPKPVLYEIRESAPVKFYDLDAPVPPDIRSTLDRMASESEAFASAVDDLAEGRIKSLAQVLDEARAAAREVGESADTVTQHFESLKETLRTQGYGGFTHQGGKLTGGKAHKVKIYWAPENQVSLSKAVATDLEGQLAGTKAKLDGGAELKDIKGAPFKAAKGNEGDTSINQWLSEKKAFDDAELSQVKRVEDLKGASELRNRRAETLSEIRYKATEDLLGPAIAKEEQVLADLMDEYTAARKDVEALAVPTGAAPVTQVSSPGNRKAVEILDDAHEEALLVAKYASDPQTAGRAITEAQELEDLLDGLSIPDITPALKGVSRAQLRSSNADKLAEEMMGEVAKLQRYEEASAKLADAIGDQAHPTSILKGKALRDAEKESTRKMLDRSARAVDDAETFGPDITPKERVQRARERQSDAQRALDEVSVQEREASTELGRAGKKAREGEKARKAALREDARTGAQAAKVGAQDAGGVLEILDIPGIPKPSDLPIVGPLLGAYLKFRTLKRAVGRAAGHVPASADNRVAALANRTRDRVARAVDRSLGLLERTGKYAVRPMPVTAAILSTRIYDDGGEDPGKGASVSAKAAARMRELASYVHTPGAIERDVRMQLRGVTDPDVIAAAEAHRRVMMEHLLKSAPKVPEQGIINTLKWEPSPAQSMSFARRLDAVNDPASVFERLAQEQTLLSLEAAEAMREVYPQLFRQAQQRAVERAGEAGTRVPYRQRVQMSLFYQMPFDSALDPVNFQITQSVYDRKPSSPAYNPAMAAPPPASVPQPAIANPVDLSKAYTPSMDRR